MAPFSPTNDVTGEARMTKFVRAFAGVKWDAAASENLPADSLVVV